MNDNNLEIMDFDPDMFADVEIRNFELETQFPMNGELQTTEEYKDTTTTTSANITEILQNIIQNCNTLNTCCQMKLANRLVEPIDFETCSSNIKIQVKALIKTLNNKKTKPTIEEQLQILQNPDETPSDKLQDAIREFEKISLSYLFNFYEKRNQDQRNFKNNIYSNRKSFTNDSYEDFFKNQAFIPEKSTFALFIYEICHRKVSEFIRLINKKTKNKETFRLILDIYYINLFARVTGLIL